MTGPFKESRGVPLWQVDEWKNRKIAERWMRRYLAVCVRDKNKEAFEKVIDQRVYKILNRHIKRGDIRLYVIESPTEELDGDLRTTIKKSNLGQVVN